MKFLNSFSIVIAAKNESNNLKALFNSLMNLNYSKNNYEVILVDDGSIDDTFSVAREYSSNLSLRVLEAKDKKYNGKKGAVDIGVNTSIFDIIITTDADCVIPPNLLHDFNEKFNQNNDVVIGFAPFFQVNGLPNKYSCFDNLRSSILTFYFTKYGLPYNAYGRNFAYRKKVFNEVNGFEKINKSLSGDDDLLLNLAVSHNFKVDTMLKADSLVFSQSKQTFKEILVQKTRHTKASHYYPVKVNLTLGLWHFVNLIVIFLPFLNINNYKLYIPLLIKIVFDVITVKSFESKLKYKFNLPSIILLQFLYEFMLVYNFLGSILLKDKWK